MSCWEEENCCFDPEDLLYEQYLKEQSTEEEEIKVIIHISRQAYPHNPLWVTEDGEKLRIEDMSTKHIKNCLKLIYKRNGNWRREFIRPFECELRRRKYVQSLGDC